MASYDLTADEVSDATGISVREIADLAAERIALTETGEESFDVQ